MIRRTVVVTLVVAACVVTSLVADRDPRLWDLTEDDTNTLTDQTLGVLDALERDVEIKVFLRRDEPGRIEAAALLNRYSRRQPRIDFEVLDPDEAPGEVRRVGVDPIFGGAAVVAGTETELAPTVTEQDLTAALARIVRGRSATVCFLTGLGELDATSTAVGGLSEARGALVDNGYDVTSVDLLVDGAIPSTCDAAVLARPTVEPEAALDALATWLDADGKLLVLTDPSESVELASLLGPYGLGVDRGVVFEADPEVTVVDDPTTPIIRTYSSAHPVVQRLAPTLFPGTQGVVVDDDREPEEGLTVSRLADTSELSYLETEPLAPAFDPAEDLGGPVTVAGAADRSRITDDGVRRTRVIVFGDADWASNGFLAEGANAALWVRSFDWLTLEEDLVAVTTNLARDRPLRLTEERRTYVQILTIGIVPALLLLAGAMVWAVRRSR